MYKITKRAIVRWITIPVAVIVALSAMLYIHYNVAAKAKQQLEYNYLRAIQDLSSSLEEIKTTLNKGMFVNSPSMMSNLSGKLSNSSSAAKVSLSQLPVEELNLENTYKFLSQVGDYSKALSDKYNNGEELTADDKKNISKLYDFAQSVSDQMWTVENQIQGGYLTFEKVAKIANNSASNQPEPQNITDGFKNMEDGFGGYPVLIYDGPFSDHIMQRNPIMLEGKPDVNVETALKSAIQASGIKTLAHTADEEGRMPSYIFKSDNATVGVSRAGGKVSYILNYRVIEDEKISVDQSIKLAKKYLSDMGIENVTDTYYETSYGMCIINFAAVENDVIMYPDLIKIGVAMDNGEILTYDARGYLTNHKVRNPKTPKINTDEAKSNITDGVEIEKTNLVIIPSSGLNEKYCYELKCRTEAGQQILIYINADTGKEEQILILRIDNHGMLTA